MKRITWRLEVNTYFEELTAQDIQWIARQIRDEIFEGEINRKDKE